MQAAEAVITSRDDLLQISQYNQSEQLSKVKPYAEQVQKKETENENEENEENEKEAAKGGKEGEEQEQEEEDEDEDEDEEYDPLGGGTLILPVIDQEDEDGWTTVK